MKILVSFCNSFYKSNSFGSSWNIIKIDDWNIIVLWYMTEWLIQPETCLRDFCMFDITVQYVNSNTSSMPLLLRSVSAFECN